MSTIEKALRVLELLSTYDAPVRLAELSRDLGMNKSTTYRMLERMGHMGYVRQEEPNGRYMLTTRMWEIGVRAFRHFDVRVWARPFLEAIEREVRETAVLAIIDRGDVVIVDKCESTQAVQTFSPLGSRTPVHSSSLGKAYLMIDPEGLLTQRRLSLQRFTPHTLATLRDLKQNIEKARAEGVAVAFDEHAEGVSGVAAPVVGVDGAVLAVVGVTLPTMRAEGERLEKAKSVVREEAAKLSRVLGASAKG